MKRAPRARRLLDAALAIRRAQRGVADERTRRELKRAERHLREELGDAVPKSVSARFLGVSPTGLERWIDEGKLRWCWLQHGEAALMLQEFRKGPDGKVGEGVSINFICDDAIAFYHAFKSRGVDVSRPLVGNGMWVTSSSDPDGYKLFFESKTDAPEETQYTD